MALRTRVATTVAMFWQMRRRVRRYVHRVVAIVPVAWSNTVVPTRGLGHVLGVKILTVVNEDKALSTIRRMRL